MPNVAVPTADEISHHGNCSNDLKLAKLRIGVLKWLIAHDGPAAITLTTPAPGARI